MAKKLKDMNITHISLVKAGANNRTFIYKSADAEPTYDRVIDVLKQDVEKGVVYGIVYEPDKVDTQGDFAEADEIQKAAYGFMKALNNRNVDKAHSFKSEDAYVAESWLVRKGDTIFPDAKEGTWAVAIKIESEELKKAVKAGELKGLSMAGTATKEEVQKEEKQDKTLAEAVKSVFASFVKSFEGKKETGINKEEIEKAIKTELEPILKEKAELAGKLEKAQSDIAAITKERDEIKAELTKSKQITDPVTIDTNDAAAIAKAATELIKKEAEKGNILSVADAVTQLTKEKK